MRSDTLTPPKIYARPAPHPSSNTHNTHPTDTRTHKTQSQTQAPFGRENFKEALTFVVVVLVASIPIAIEIVCTATLALGSRQLSAEGAIVTRLGSIEEMAGMNMLCSVSLPCMALGVLPPPPSLPFCVSLSARAHLCAPERRAINESAAAP